MFMNLYLLAAAAEPAATSAGIQLNDVIGGGAGATVLGLVWYVAKFIMDRAVPSRSDSRANVGMVLEGLNNVVKVLQEEKAAETARMASKQLRIEELDKAAEVDAATIKELRNEVFELGQVVKRKDITIRTLVTELQRMGANVSGFELDTTVQPIITYADPNSR
jgi:uncharacterized protein YydD (DUF2326 family)